MSQGTARGRLWHGYRLPQGDRLWHDYRRPQGDILWHGNRRPQGSRGGKPLVYTTACWYGPFSIDTSWCRRLVGTGLAPVRLVATLAVAGCHAYRAAFRACLWRASPSPTAPFCLVATLEIAGCPAHIVPPSVRAD